MSIERRLTALEAFRAGVRGHRRITAIVHSIVSPDFLHSPRVRAEFYGQVLHRLDDESEEDFERRAVAAATAAARAGVLPCLELVGAELAAPDHA